MVGGEENPREKLWRRAPFLVDIQSQIAERNVGNPIQVFPALNDRDPAVTPWKQIVVVDDDASSVFLTANKLRQLGIVTVGVSGSEAPFYAAAYLGYLSKQNRQEMGMILIDLMLHSPDQVDGIHLAAYIRQLDGYAQTPIGIYTVSHYADSGRAQGEGEKVFDQRVAAVNAVTVSKITSISEVLNTVDPRAREQAQKLGVLR